MWAALRSVFLSLAAAILFSIPADSAESIAVVTEDWRPYSYAEDGVVKGSSTKIVRAVLDRAGITYSIQVLPWARAFRDASVKPNILIYALGRNSEREPNFHWIGQVTPTNHAYFYRLKSRTDIVVDELSDAKKYMVSTNNKSSSHTILVENGFENIETTRHQELSINLLMRGRTDLLVIPEQSIAAHFEKLEYSIDLVEKVFLLVKGESFMAFSKNTAMDLASRARAAYQELLDEKKNPAY